MHALTSSDGIIVYTSLNNINLHILKLKDPRSQVIKEACVTVSYISQAMGHNAITLAVRILPTLVSLLVKPVKIIAKSAENSIGSIIQVN